MDTIAWTENKVNLDSEVVPTHWHGITNEDKKGWAYAYQKDIDRELAKMTEWLKANPKKLKTNYRKFITNWLSDYGMKRRQKNQECKTTQELFSQASVF